MAEDCIFSLLKWVIEEFKKFWFWHLGFWIGYLVIKILVVEFFRENLWIVLEVELVSLPLKMAAAYFLVYFLVPQYLLTGKYLKFILGLTTATIIVAFLRRVTDIYIVYPITILYTDEIDFWNWKGALRNLIFIYPVVGLGSGIYFLVNWIRDYKSRMELAQQKLNAELQLLKAQIHPHFLFNTINNIYSLALDQSKKVPEALISLSDLLSYMIYECSVPKIDLDSEIKQLKNYIKLEKLRYGTRLNISFEIKGETSNVQIAPLILLPFVDNAFKHGAGNAIENCSIQISLNINEKQIEFNIINSLYQVETKKGGIGLPNVKRRLEMEYSNCHELKITRSDDVFKVNLALNP